MSEEKTEVASLFDLGYHEVAEVNKYTKVLRVPNGWIYIITKRDGTIVQSCTSVFVPEYIPIPPPEMQDGNDLLDAEICDMLNGILQTPLSIDPIQVNRIIRQLQKRNQRGE